MTPKMETGSSPGRPGRLPEKVLSPALVGLVVLGALWVAVSFRFLDSPPGGDFIGDMFWVDLLSPHVLSGSLPDWNPRSALGHPLLIQRMNLMLFLPAIVLKALVGSTEAAAKIYLLLGHTLSGLGFYFLARLYTRRRSAAAFAALLFLVAPVHVSELRLSGHWSVAQSYALSPVVLALIVLTVREEGRRGLLRALLLGGAAAWLAWADNERTATLVLLAILFAAYEVAVKDAQARNGAVGRLGLAAVSAAGLSAGFLLPALLDRKQLLLSGVTVPDFGFRFWNTSSPPFELWHPAFAVDRLFSVSRLPLFNGLMHPIAHVHLGWIPILLAAGAVFQVARSDGERRRLVLVLLAASLLLVQLSMGSNTILGSTYETLRPFVGTTFAAAFLLLAALIVASLLVRVFRKRGVRAGLGWTAGVIYLAVGAPYLLLSRLPPFDSMRSTLWFLTINLPILLSLLAALFLDGIDLSEARSGRAVIALAALAWLDLWAYLWIPVGLPPGTTEMYRSVGQELGKDPDSFRIAWVPYETARPEEAYADRFTDKRDYGSWIFWCSGTWGGRAVATGFWRLRKAMDLARRRDPRAVPAGEDALRYFALCDVKYLLIYGRHERFRPFLGHGLTPVGRAGYLVLARNDFWEPDRALRLPEDPEGRLEVLSRPDMETIEATFRGSGAVTVSEAYHPYWKADLDGRPVPVEPVEGAFIGLRAAGPGTHRLRLHFETPWYYRASALLSIVTAAAAAVASAFLWRVRAVRNPPSSGARQEGPG